MHVLHVSKDGYLQPTWIRIEAIDEQGISFIMWKRGVGEQRTNVNYCQGRQTRD